MATTVRILGLDPGLVRTGWGVVDVSGSRLRHVAHGECASGRGTLPVRLATLYRGLEIVLKEHAPGEIAVEESFVSRNATTTLLLGHARAVCLLVPAMAGLPLAEYAPNQVKKAVVGAGHADKRQIAFMVRTLLPGSDISEGNSADALAVAICHASYARNVRRVVSTGRTPAGGSREDAA